MKFPTLPARIALFVVILATTFSLTAEDKFTATIQSNPKTKTTSIQISIPKTAAGNTIQSIFLERKSATGLDILVPVMATEGPGDYSIYMILPSSIAEHSSIRVTHNRSFAQAGDGKFTTSQAIQGGESYVIPLIVTEKK